VTLESDAVGKMFSSFVATRTAKMEIEIRGAAKNTKNRVAIDGYIEWKGGMTMFAANFVHDFESGVIARCSDHYIRAVVSTLNIFYTSPPKVHGQDFLPYALKEFFVPILQVKEYTNVNSFACLDLDGISTLDFGWQFKRGLARRSERAACGECLDFNCPDVTDRITIQVLVRVDTEFGLWHHALSFTSAK
jgi:hypothetical protein